jgi:hypothetical protein
METNPYAIPPSSSQTWETDILEPYLSGAVYPLQFRFKILALAPQIYLVDSNGRNLLYIKQKLFKFKEHIEIFTDESRSTKVAEIRADRVIDWSAKYNFTDAVGRQIGQVKRRGARSLWRASYDVLDPGDERVDYEMREESAMTKFLDGMFSQIPIIGILAGYVFNPRYRVTPVGGQAPVMHVVKKPALFEGKFELTKHGQLSSRQELNVLLSVFMMLLLERTRG